MVILLCAAAALLTAVPASLALKVHGSGQNCTPGAHLSSLAGESFDLKQPGEHVLLRVPREPAEAPLIRLDGTFVAADYAPCLLYLSNVTIQGKWLGSKKAHLALLNGSLSIKISSTSPTFAGPWRSIKGFAVEPGGGDGGGGGGPEAFPDTVHISVSPLLMATRPWQLVGAAGNPTLRFHVGPQDGTRRPVISIAQGLREGMDVSLANMWGFKSESVAGLLGTEKHERLVEAQTPACEVHMQRRSRHYEASRISSSWSVQPTHLRNLANENFLMNRPGEFELLRAPRQKTQPALLRVRGAFLSADDASCVVYLSAVTLSGEWFGGRVVHVRSSNGSFAMKVSSLDPPAAGAWRAVDGFAAAESGPQALPETVEVAAAAAHGPPAFKLQLGPKQAPVRPSILITQAVHGGLDISLSDMNSIDVPEMAGLLGTDKHDKALNLRTAACEAGLQRFREAPPGSALAASWGL